LPGYFFHSGGRIVSVILGFAFTLFTAAIVILGDFLIKLAADDGKTMFSVLVIVGCALYAISALLWFFALHHITLSQAGVAFSMFTLLALCAIGVIYFGEKLYLREYAGIGCALMAMVLLVRIT
jgi:undecaprenyl phosphate-alpha-L-ara4N flippase subunit ArnF